MVEYRSGLIATLLMFTVVITHHAKAESVPGLEPGTTISSELMFSTQLLSISPDDQLDIVIGSRKGQGALRNIKVFYVDSVTKKAKLVGPVNSIRQLESAVKAGDEISIYHAQDFPSWRFRTLLVLVSFATPILFQKSRYSLVVLFATITVVGITFVWIRKDTGYLLDGRWKFSDFTVPSCMCVVAGLLGMAVARFKNY